MNIFRSIRRTFSTKYFAPFGNSIFYQRLFATEWFREKIYELVLRGQSANKISPEDINVRNLVAQVCADGAREAEIAIASIQQAIESLKKEICAMARELLESENNSSDNSASVVDFSNDNPNSASLPAYVCTALQEAHKIVAETVLVWLRIVTYSFLFLLFAVVDVALCYSFFSSIHAGVNGRVPLNKRFAVILDSFVPLACVVILHFGLDQFKHKQVIKWVGLVLIIPALIFLFNFGCAQGMLVAKSTTETLFPWKLPDEIEASKILEMRKKREQGVEEKKEFEKTFHLDRASFTARITFFGLAIILVNFAAFFASHMLSGALADYKRRRRALNFICKYKQLPDLCTSLKKAEIEKRDLLNSSFQQLAAVASTDQLVQMYSVGLGWAEYTCTDMEAFLRWDKPILSWFSQLVYRKPILYCDPVKLRGLIEEARESAERVNESKNSIPVLELEELLPIKVTTNTKGGNGHRPNNNFSE